jgi:hypothetical protein
MVFLTLIRLLRDIIGLIAAIGAAVTGVLVYGGIENPILFPAVVSLTALVAWCFAQRKEWVLMDRRNLKSRQCGYRISN